MTSSYREPSPIQDGTDQAGADTLVIKVFRCAMTGFSLGETHCWNIGWQALAAALPPGEVGPLFGHFYSLARALQAASQRPLLIWPPTCRGLCDDEALALLTIARAQQGDLAGALTAATQLCIDELGDVLQAAQSLAAALANRGLFVGLANPEQTSGLELQTVLPRSLLIPCANPR